MKSTWSKKKLRHLIAECTKNLPNQNDKFPPDYQDLIDPTHSIQIRMLWFLIVFACFLTCSYQITDRICFYFSYPLAVDIHIDYMQSLQLPPIVFCSPENDYLIELFEDQGKYDELVCMIPLIKMWDEDELDYNKVWNYDNTSNILDKILFDKDKIVLGPISMPLSNSIFGQCTGIIINETLRGKKLRFKLSMSFLPGKLCSSRVSIGSVNYKTDFSLLMAVLSGYHYDLKLGFKSYDFGSTQKRPCVTYAEFQKCYKRCIIKQLFETARCRLPFFDPNIKLPVCNTSNNEEGKYSYFRALQTILVPKVYTKCNCLQTCSDLTYYLTYYNVHQITSNETIIQVSVDNLGVSLTQRIVYDRIKLLTDLGGNLSLFMGLSLLSIAEIVYKIRVFSSRREKKEKLNKIEALILKMYTTDKEARVESSGVNCLWIATGILCVSLAIYMFQERAKYYFTFPTRNVVELDYLKHVAMPSLTVCGENLKMPYYKQLHVGNKIGNITNWCDVELTDLYQMKTKYTWEFLWDATRLDPMENSLHMFMESLQLVSVNATPSIVATHLGNCDHFKFSKTEYSGFFTLHPIPFLYFNKLPIYECPNAAYKIFVSDFDSSNFETFDQLTTIDAPVHATTLNDIQMRLFSRLNTRINPCTDISKLKECRRSCLIKQIKDAELCKLPFLEAVIGNISLCNSTTEAKKSVTTFLRMTNNLTKSCPCRRLCNEINFNFNSYTQLQAIDQPFVIIFLMHTNLVEHILEVRQYTLIAFFCDIGNCCGLALGMCVLSFIRYAHKAISWAFKV
uniref:Uncharacterized protein n=1 Tax=Strigamia maritima TaxID=126957 RepID=T1JD34_STRMM